MSVCIVCKKPTVSEFLDLGVTSLANKFIAKEDLNQTEPAFPLAVGFCKSCHHVQLTDLVPPVDMFEDYLYISSLSETLVNHLHGLAETVSSRLKLGRDNLVVDVGCNDGTLLAGFKKEGVRPFGIDPAANLAALANEKGIDTHVGFFGKATAEKLLNAHGPASAITATNVFPHIPDLADFVSGLNLLLAEDGAFILEAHYLQDLMGQGAWDTVYHEHCSYWALGPMINLFAQFGLEVFDVERLPIHHGQLRVWVQHSGQRPVSGAVKALLESEREAGLHDIQTFATFADKARAARDKLIHTLDDLRKDGKTVVGYGAPAKGNTLLTFLGLGPDNISYIADKSPLKQGRYTPGTHIPVVPAERILEEQPDYILLLAWNFADEILAQQSEYRARGGKFIIPVPKVKIV